MVFHNLLTTNMVCFRNPKSKFRNVLALPTAIANRMQCPPVLCPRKHKNTKTRKHKNTKTRKHKNTKTRKHENTKTPKHENTKTQKHTLSPQFQKNMANRMQCQRFICNVGNIKPLKSKKKLYFFLGLFSVFSFEVKILWRQL